MRFANRACAGGSGSPTLRPATLGGFPRTRPAFVSVVVPVRDEIEYLPAQLAALAAQTYRGPWELLVCDNGSVDGTAALAASWSDRIAHLRVLDASERRGINSTRNVGVRHARGDFVAFCDGDDVVTPGWLEALVTAAPSADIVGGRLDRASLNDASTRPLEEPADRLPFKHGFLSAVSGGNCGVWRAVADDLPWDEDFRYGGSDTEFSWRAHLAGYRLAFVPEAVVAVREPVDLRALARQWYGYGFSAPALFRRFRDDGMRRSSVTGAMRAWAWIAVHALDLRGPIARRRQWVRLAANRAGRLVASVRERTLFL